MALFLLALAATAFAQTLGVYPDICPPAGSQLRTNSTPIGHCPGDFDIRRPNLEVVCESVFAPTRLGFTPQWRYLVKELVAYILNKLIMT
jgi:hypothetical protein